MQRKPSTNRYTFLTYVFFLILISFCTNQYYAYLGVLPVDSFSTFNAGYDILNGSVPFKDYWTLKGIVLDIIQAAFFKIFGVSWFSYSIHASTFNSIFALATFFTLKKFDLDNKYSFFYATLASILMYPTYGIPFTDHSTAIFCMLSIYSLCLAIKLQKNIYWFLIPILMFLAFFTKQAPTGYFGILIIIISCLYLILNSKKEIFFFGTLGIIFSIGIFLSYVYINEISFDDIIVQYFLYPMSLGETRLEWLFPIEIQRFVIRHKLIYLALGLPIFLLFKSIFKNFLSILEKENLIFLLLLGTLLIFITHQLMTINGLYIFFLIPVFAGFSHIYSKKLNKNFLVNFFLILSFISTVYYHQKYISKRDTLLLRKLDLNQSIDAVILSDKLKNLRWLTHHYPKNPEIEIKNLLDTIKIIKKDSRKKMIVTDYQFISVELSMKDNSAARIWWRHHIYPSGPDQKYFLEWKKFLLKQIIEKNIEVIYTVHPLEGEENIFQDLLDEKCYSNKKLNKILVLQIINNCDDLNFFLKS
jgi:hypothetical protein